MGRDTLSAIYNVIPWLNYQNVVFNGVTTNITNITVRGYNDCSLAALICSALGPYQSPSVEVDQCNVINPLASYYCANGYGLPYAYNEIRPLGGYGSLAVCIPNILKDEIDIPLLTALAGTTPSGTAKQLRIDYPIDASGASLTQAQANTAFSWTQQLYVNLGGVQVAAAY